MNRAPVPSLALLVVMLAALAPHAARAQAPEDPSRLFPRQARIETAGQRGMVRLPLPPSVLEASRPDLSDVRVHRADGSEVAYVVQSGLPEEQSELTLTPTSAERRIVHADSLRPHSVETFELAPPTHAQSGARHTLYIGSQLGDFVRQVRVAGPDGETLAEGTVFRMPNPRRERLFLALPETGDRITVQIEGEGAYLEPVFRVAATQAPIEPVTYSRPLEASAVRHAEGRTVLDVVRPIGLSPDTLRIVTTGTFAREVRVFDVRPGDGAVQIARATLFRVEDLGVESLDVRLGPTRGERLRIEIDNGDAGPLEARFEAVVQQPSLLFRATPEPHHLRFGGGRARPPRYDLRAVMATGLADQLMRAVDLPVAGLGALEDNPSFDDSPALAFAMRPGREPDRAAFTHVATLVVENAAEGLSRVRIPPAVQALARDDLGDIRVIDESGRQQPYLVASTDLADPVEARVTVRPEGRETHYRIEPSSGRARVQRLTFQPDASYVARSFMLTGVGEDSESTWLADGMLSREPDDPQPIHIDMVPTWVTALELVVQDGNDAPLELSETTVHVVSPTLSLAASDGTYRMLVGNPYAEPPTYEIANAPAWVLDVRAGSGTVGAPTANPEHVEPEWYDAIDAQSIALWSMLLLALIVLAVLTVRLAKSTPEPAGPGSGPPPSDGSPPRDDLGDEAESDDGEVPESEAGPGAEETVPSRF
ncbi:MAG: hypothetical protein AB8I08_30655 [Sandaracinaceae bacterium]